MRHRLQWFIQLRADGLRKGDEHPAYMYTPHGVQHTLPTDAAGGAATGDTGRRSLTSLSADAEYFWFLLIVMSTAADRCRVGRLWPDSNCRRRVDRYPTLIDASRAL